MASPQCENGFVMVANELWDALILAKLGKEDMSVFLAIIRKTYGFKKKRDVIPISQLQNMTKLPRQSVCRALKRLKSLKMISSHAVATRTPSIYAPNKDWEQWLPSHALVTTSHGSATIPSHGSVSSLVTPARPSKESIQKKQTKEKNLCHENVTCLGRKPSRDASLETWEKALGNGLRTWFVDEFWPIQLRKAQKKSAVQAIFRLNPDSCLRETIIKAYSRQVKDDFSKREPDKIPHPATWINGERWTDETTDPLETLKAWAEGNG